MALFKNQHLGKITGRIGDNIFKTRNGTSYVAAPAMVFHKSNSPGCVHARKVFAITNKLFSALGKIYPVKTLWKEAPISNGTFINKMQKVNKDMVGEDYDLTNIRMAPFEKLFSIEVDSYSFSVDTFTLNIKKPEAARNFSTGAKCSIGGAIHAQKLVTDNYGVVSEAHYFITLQSDDILYKESGVQIFTMGLNTTEIQIMKECEDKKFYAFMLVKEQDGRPSNASATVSGQL